MTQGNKSCKDCRYGREVPVVIDNDTVTRLCCHHPNASLETGGFPPLTMACRINETMCGMSMRWFEMK